MPFDPDEFDALMGSVPVAPSAPGPIGIPGSGAAGGSNIPDLSLGGAIPTDEIGSEYGLPGPDPGWLALLLGGVKSEFAGPIVGLGERVGIAPEGTRRGWREEFEEDRLNFLTADPSVARTVTAGLAELLPGAVPYVKAPAAAGFVAGKIATAGSLMKSSRPLLQKIGQIVAKNPERIAKLSMGAVTATEGGLIGLGETSGYGPEATLIGTGLGVLGGGVLGGIAAMAPREKGMRHFMRDPDSLTNLMDDVVGLKKFFQQYFRSGGRVPRPVYDKWLEHMGSVQGWTQKAQKRNRDLDKAIAKWESDPIKSRAGVDVSTGRGTIVEPPRTRAELELEVDAYLSRQPDPKRVVVDEDGNQKKILGVIQEDPVLKAIDPDISRIAFDMKKDVLDLQSQILASPYYTREFKKIVSQSQGGYQHTSFVIKDLPAERLAKIAAGGTEDASYRALFDWHKDNMPDMTDAEAHRFVETHLALYPMVHKGQGLSRSAHGILSKDQRVLKKLKVADDPVFSLFYGKIDSPYINNMKTIFFMSHSLAQRRFWGDTHKLLLGLSDEWGPMALKGRYLSSKTGRVLDPEGAANSRFVQAEAGKDFLSGTGIHIDEDFVGPGGSQLESPVMMRNGKLTPEGEQAREMIRQQQIAGLTDERGVGTQVLTSDDLDLIERRTDAALRNYFDNVAEVEYTVSQNGEFVTKVSIQDIDDQGYAQLDILGKSDGGHSPVDSNTFGPRNLRAVAREILARNPRIKGFSGSRVTGIRAASGRRDTQIKVSGGARGREIQHDKAYLPYPANKQSARGDGQAGVLSQSRESRVLNAESVTKRNPDGDFAPIFIREDMVEALADLEHVTSRAPFAALNAWHKMAKTVYSPQTHARNMISQVLMITLQGHSPISSNTRAALGAAFEDVKLLNKVGGITEDARRAASTLASNGSLGGNVISKEYERSLERAFARLTDQELSGHGILAKKKKRTLEFLHEKGKWAQGAYIAQDDAGKIFLYLAEEKRYLKAFRAMGDSETVALRKAGKRAAYIVGQTMQIYDRVPKAVKMIRDFPFFGPFIAFPSEIARNVKNTLRIAVEDMRTPGLRGAGAKRLSGLLFTLGVIGTTIEKASDFQSGFDEKSRNALKSSFLPFYMKNSQIYVYASKNKGKVDIADLSFMDPYNYLRKPVTAFIRSMDQGDRVAEAAFDAAVEALDPVLSPEIFWGELMRMGGQLSRKEQSSMNDKAKTILYRMYRSFAPGGVITGERFLRGTGAEWSKNVLPKSTIYGREYKWLNELAAMVGPRVMKVDLNQAMQFHGREYMSGTRTAASLYNGEAKKLDKSPYRIGKARKEALEIHKATSERTMQHIANAREVGLSDAEIYFYLTRGGGGIGQRDARALMVGRVPYAKSLYKSY